MHRTLRKVLKSLEMQSKPMRRLPKERNKMIKWIALMPIGLTLLLVFGAIFDRSPIELVVIVWFFICIFGVIYAIDQFFNEEIK